jgi:hypothetical protein
MLSGVKGFIFVLWKFFQKLKFNNMKKTFLILFTVTAMFSFTQCNNTAPEKLCNDSGMRGKIISSLMSNDAYMNEVMDSMRTKHADAMLTSCFNMAKSDKQMQGNMMAKMTSMCSADSSMCKMMMDKTMDMCDADQSKCNMMMGSMQAHPKIMKSMHNMKMGQMKEMHHHQQ